MKNPFKKISLANLLASLREVSARFPLSVILALAITALCIYAIAFGNSISPDIAAIIYKSIATLVLTFFLSAGIYLLGESYNLSRVQKNLLQIISVAFGFGFYFTLNKSFLESMESVMSF